MDTSNTRLLAEIGKFQTVRQSRIHEMVERINEQGVPLKVEAVFALANCRSPGRPHVARALVKGGFCSSLDQAFERFLKKNRPAWVPKAKMSAQTAIELIHQAGGMAVMAHPGLNRTDEVIPVIAQAGLDGLECFHTKHSPSASAHYLSMAKQFNLLVTGGSDCHGLSKGRPLIGSVRLPYEHVQKLVAARARRNAVPGTQT
jgi:predicted metal-dependent phosphoesterase TrpH